MTISAYERATALTPAGDGVFTLDVPDGWQQGRGAYGGIALGALMRAIETTEPDRARIPRTLTGELAGPVQVGAATIRVTTLRRGKSQSNLRADLLQEGQVLATASAVLSAPRTPAESVTRPCSAHPAFEALPPVPPMGAMGPRFASHFEYRITGPAPFSRASEPRAHGWLRMREPVSSFDAAATIAHLDAYWSAIASIEPTPRMFATITFVAELLADPRTLSPIEPFFHDARVLAAQDGFVVEERALYQGERLVAMNHQTFAML
jgi:acyl-CoA thioesterase